ncbi:arginase family protein [Rhodobacteraceae bacterium HSP-20]|uniref:Arginase family protein n=1 Tax=Paragemmobacter amnigenus TaxID=2852097 RepID=A0ABS6J6S1_9RHOB|nr:arginase family protein [Rhodobacter amnigenus]MBU9699455.1 arginase family protein [Rhodobacter amnigenus]MBV4390682.1 arginase family protein [Rhodobacter amnigenus]
MATLGAMFGAGRVETFMGLPACRDLAALEAKVAILGAAGCTPYPSVGFYCAGGPAAIRAAGAAYAANLAHVDFDLGGPVLPEGVVAVDAGDIEVREGDAAGNRARLRAAVETVLERGAVPVLIGGDDSVPIPMLQALAVTGRKVTVLQIDAHIDWRDEVQGERWGLSSTMRRASEMGHVERIVQVGQRGIGSARMSDLRDAMAWGVEFVPAGEVARAGVWRAVDLIPEGAEVVICLDVDALDPSVMPAAIGRTAGGLSYWQVMELVGAVAEKARIAAFDMVEFMPDRDIDGMGAMLAAQMLAGVTGIIARQS